MSFRVYREIPLQQTFITNIQGGGGGGDCSCCDISATIDISAMFDVSATFDISATFDVSYNIDVSSHIDVSGYFDISSVSATYLQNTNNAIGKIQVADGTNMDAFGRFRISEPVTLYEATLISDDQSLIFDTSGTGNAVYLPNESMMRLDVSSNGQYEIRQTHFFAHYQPGKCLTSVISFIFGDKTSDTIKRVGFFDASDGIFLDQSEGILYFVVRTSTSGTPVERARIPQSSWNIDKLDGSGSSGLTLDTTYANILHIDMQWLGVGRSRCGFYLQGRLIYAHQFIFSDLLAPYIRTPYLPVRYEIRSTPSISTTRSMFQICNTIISEGGFENLGIIRNYAMDTGIQQNDSSEHYVMSIRLKPNYAKCVIIPIDFSVFTSSGNYIVRLRSRTTLTGATFAAGSTEAALIDTAASGFSGGILIASDYISGTFSRISLNALQRTNLVIQSDINGLTDILTITIQRLSSQGAYTPLASITWREIV